MPKVAFPAISAGGYGYPKEQAAEIACEAVREFLTIYANLSCFNLIVFCMWEENMAIYEEQMRLTFTAGAFPLTLARPSTAPTSLSRASLPGWMPAVSTVITISGLKTVVHLWDIPTWTLMVPDLDRTDDPSAYHRRPIRVIDQNITDRVALYAGDIVRFGVDVIVNSANTNMEITHGVCEAIHHAAGPQLLAASKPLAPCPECKAKITPGFNLPAKAVIHTVGPQIAQDVFPTREECHRLE